MSNADEIKKLRYELGRQEHLAKSRYDESERLRKELEKSREFLDAAQAIMDTVLITVTVMCGEWGEDGKYELTLPQFSVRDCLDSFRLEVERREGLNALIVTER